MYERPTVVVDGSNVCCDRRFDDTGDLARWDRLVAVVEAYREHVDPDAVVLVIADANLERKLSRDDRRLMRSATSEGWYRSVDGDADAVVLREAREANACIISRDRFVDYRRQHDWIDDNDTLFYDWTRTAAGAHVKQRNMGRHTGFSISRAAERTMLKERGLLDRSRGRERVRQTLLDRRYVCDNPMCLAAKLTPDDVGIPQRRRDGAPACPGCGKDVVDAGARLAGVQLRLITDDSEQRLQVTTSQSLELGRGQTTPDGLDPSLVLPAEDRCRISRQHLLLEFDGQHLVVTDLGSTGGTGLMRWDGAAEATAAPVPLTANEPVRLNSRDEVVLSGVIRIAHSGQRFAVRARGT
jgi:pSer/pThr/pTyr-binding forkhead associated (FHA) protein